MERPLLPIIKKTAHWALLLVVTGSGLILACHVWVARAAAVHCHKTLEKTPAMPVGLVLGTSPYVRGGANNPFFTARIRAAAEVFEAGKVRVLVVSGDNSTREYDEPTAMKAALVAAGVPEARIYCDYAGFRTLDSVVRAQTIFGQKRFLIISQRFHNERAVFLARHRGLDAEAFDAQDVPRALAPATFWREYLARVQAVLDVIVFYTEPKFQGAPVKIEGLAVE